VLLVVFVIVVVLGLVVAGLATYATSTLMYGQTSEQRADRFAAAQGAMDNALERLEIKRSLCGTNLGVGSITEPFPATINGATATVTCRSLGGSSGDVDGWALVLTGIGNSGADLATQGAASTQKVIGGPVWMERPTSLDLKSQVLVKGDLWYPQSCTPNQFTGLDLHARLSYTPGNGTMCTSGSWTSTFRAPTTNVPTTVSSTNNVTVAPDAYGCTVFEPGRYTAVPMLGSNNYF
jgi:hypothetical protein